MIGFAGIAIGFVLMVTLMLLGLHIATVMFAVGAAAAVIYLGVDTLFEFGNNFWSTLNDFLLTSIPLFILLGEILVRSGITDRMYASLSDWLSGMPGGLLHTNIGACALFSAFSGSSVATAAAIGTVALPAFRQRKYNERLVLGSLAAGGTLGILIPPSVNMIVYGAMTNTSVGQLFAAGIAPGLLLAGLFMCVIAALAIIFPRFASRPEARPPFREKLRRLAGLIAPLSTIFVVMGTIYAGWATPTEAAGVGVVMALFLALVSGRLTIAMLHEAFVSTAKISAMILLIISAAFFFNFIVGLLGVPQILSKFVVEYGATPLAVIATLTIFYLILGCFLETMSMMVGTIPIVFPIVTAVGIDPIWFGVFLVIMMELALITPPVGMNLYVVQGVRGGGPISDVVIGTLPFLLAMLVLVVLITAYPQIVLGLPQLIYR